MNTGQSVSFAEFLRVFFKIGVLSFGGPAAQVAVMQRVVIDEKRWLEEREFLAALSFCMLLPGPEAMQLATWLGWRLRGTLGGVIAGTLFVLPGALVMLGLAALYVHYGASPVVEVLFIGVKAAVIAVVIAALIKLARRALSGYFLWVLAGVAFVAMFALHVPFPIVIGLAGCIGLCLPVSQEGVSMHAGGTASAVGTLKTAGMWLALWWVPLLFFAAVDPNGLLWQVGRFFSTLAVLSFGGAYAVLAWLAQDAVGQFQWLSTEQMMDGLGLAETTPGPLILVTEFVGYLAGAGQGGVGLALAAAGVTLWATFLPCFLWIFTGAPWLAWVCNQPRLAGALRAITASVVGVMLSLSVWFAVHALFGTVSNASFGPVTVPAPELTSLDWRVLGLIGVSALAVFRFKLGVVTVLGISCVLSTALHYIAN